MVEANQEGLEEFLSSLEDYVPTIPDDLTNHYLAKSGLQANDVRLTRLVSIAAQKFVADIANDALQYCKIRQQAVGKEKKAQALMNKDKRLILTSEDLTTALREYGVNITKQEYYADHPVAGSGSAPAPAAPSQPNS
eukprot:jgi/Chlat1/5866/Chrsp4S06377